MNRMRRILGIVACALVLIATTRPLPVQAQAFPSRPISLIVLLAPGGVTDAAARFFAERLSARLGVPVRVDNRPGGAGVVGVATLARAAPDGYTLCFCSSAPITLLPVQRNDLPYDARALRVVSHLYDVDLFFVARKDLGIATLADLVATARARPGQLSYGSTGAGGITHLGMELFQRMSGIDVVHVPYAGGAPLMLDLLGGRIELGVVSAMEAERYRREGKIDVLGSTGEQRLPLLADVPPIGESYAGFLANSWGGLIAPPGTPDSVVARLREAVTAVLGDEEMRNYLRRIGLTPVPAAPPEAFERALEAERQRWAELLRTASPATR
jgi:tripartite-type tricarboxylate transporter receptor subunit TctC